MASSASHPLPFCSSASRSPDAPHPPQRHKRGALLAVLRGMTIAPHVGSGHTRGSGCTRPRAGLSFALFGVFCLPGTRSLLESSPRRGVPRFEDGAAGGQSGPLQRDVTSSLAGRYDVARRLALPERNDERRAAAVS